MLTNNNRTKISNAISSGIVSVPSILEQVLVPGIIYWLEALDGCRVLVWKSRWKFRSRPMPGPPKETRIETLVAFTTFVEEWSVPMWYRGVGNSEEHKLVPSLYRHPDRAGPTKLLEYEADIIRLFESRSEPYRNRPLRNESNWDLLFLMQHYGVPTRLLDWTQNPYFGLFFALTQAKPSEKADTLYENDAAVWVLDAVQWNKRAFQGYTIPATLTADNVTVNNSFAPGKGAAEVRFSDPAAIFGAYNSTRIVAQRGVFTMFGNDATPMEEVFQHKDYPENCLVKLVIPKESIGDLLRKTTNIGITDSVIFPDLEGLARELKREFRYRA